MQTAPRPDLNSPTDILRRIYALLTGVLGLGGTAVASGGVLAGGAVTPLAGDTAGKVRLVSDDVLQALSIELRLTNLLLAQRFGVAEDLAALRDGLYSDLANDPLFNA